MTKHSLNFKQNILKKLQKVIPNCFTEGKLDFEKLKVFLSDQIEFHNERYHLNWAGKSNAFRILQSPCYKTLNPCRQESLNFDETENLFIEGDNLEVLKILQKSYFSKIKMIYIDPPYNTGNDFIYKDDYSETLYEYRKKVGDVDEKGNTMKEGLFKNTKENGHYHSNWLNMMYPRLFLARNLLRKDGIIFVSIDDNEVHNLRLIMDEIFGEKNFVAEFVWNTKKSAQGMITKYRVVPNHEYVLAYCKSYEHFQFIGLDRTSEGFSNPDNDERGPWKRQYLQRFGQGFPIRKIVDPKTNQEYTFESPYTEKKLNQWIQENRILFPKDGIGYPAKKEFLSEYKNKRQLVTSLGVFNTKSSTEKLYKLFEDRKIFPNPKPVELIKFFLKVTTKSSDLILDFFAGSGTTAQAVMELNIEDGSNRKFILVQLPEPASLESEAYKAGYKTIADIAKERIRRTAKRIQNEFNIGKNTDLGFRVFKLEESNFKYWQPFVPENGKEIKQAIKEFTDNVQSKATIENILYELMLKNGKKLTDKVQKFFFKESVSFEKEQSGSKSIPISSKEGEFWLVEDKELMIILKPIDKSTIDEILKIKPKKVVFLDTIFKENDFIKANFIFSLRNAGIECKSY